MAQTIPSANYWVSNVSSLLRRGLWAVTGGSRPGNRRLERDRRINRRLKVKFEARISSESGRMQVDGVNIHPEGALVMARQPLAPQTVVFVQLKSFGLMGFAQVRHCTGQGESGYAIGVEFPSPLMKEEVASWQFQQVHQTGAGRLEELETSMPMGRALRAI